MTCRSDYKGLASIDVRLAPGMQDCGPADRYRRRRGLRSHSSRFVSSQELVSVLCTLCHPFCRHAQVNDMNGTPASRRGPGDLLTHSPCNKSFAAPQTNVCNMNGTPAQVNPFNAMEHTRRRVRCRARLAAVV